MRQEEPGSVTGKGRRRDVDIFQISWAGQNPESTGVLDRREEAIKPEFREPRADT